MKKINPFFLGAIVALGLCACNNDDDDKVKTDINVVSSVAEVGAIDKNAVDFNDLNTLQDFNTDFSNATVEFSNKHTHTYNLSNSSLDNLFKDAENKYSTEYLAKDLEDAKAFVQEWQTKLDQLPVAQFKYEVNLRFESQRMLGTDGLFFQQDLGKLSHNTMPQPQ